jgi:hypothetical protein
MALDPVDEMGVRQLAARYCDAVARFDVDLYGSLWTDDAVWETTRGDIVGRDAVLATYTKLRARSRLSVQALLAGVVEDGRAGDPPGALRATWHIREFGLPTQGEPYELIGTYRDVCVPGPDGWQFARRAFEPLYRGPVAMPGTVFGAEEPG